MQLHSLLPSRFFFQPARRIPEKRGFCWQGIWPPVFKFLEIRLCISLSFPRGGTPIHYLYGYVPPKGVLILKLLIQNRVSISEAFFRTGFNISNARKLHFCKQTFEIIQGQVAFKHTVQCVNKQTVVLLLHLRTEYKKWAHFQNGVSVLGRILKWGIKNWPISRTGYQFQGKFFQIGRAHV